MAYTIRRPTGMEPAGRLPGFLARTQWGPSSPKWRIELMESPRFVRLLDVARRRRWQWLSGAAVAVLMLASVSVDCGRTFVISDARDVPVAGAYVGYHYEGTTFALVEAVSYRAGRQVFVQSDPLGRVVIPRTVNVRWPFVQSRPRINVDFIYAPTLHNGLAWVSRLGVVSRPGEFVVAPDRTRVLLEDVSHDPVLWQGTLLNISSLLGGLGREPTRGMEATTVRVELIRHFLAEYAAILERYGDTPRPRPQMPASLEYARDEEKRTWREMVEKDLTARPRWRDELQRQFGTEADIYAGRSPAS